MTTQGLDPLAGATVKAFLVEGGGRKCSKIIEVHILDLASLHPAVILKKSSV